MFQLLLQPDPEAMGDAADGATLENGDVSKTKMIRRKTIMKSSATPALQEFLLSFKSITELHEVYTFQTLFKSLTT